MAVPIFPAASAVTGTHLPSSEAHWIELLEAGREDAVD